MLSDYQEHRQLLLSTIVKWTNLFVLAAVVLNSYFLLSDFWPTLAQNLASLGMVAIGLGCLRLARGGRLELAIRVYLITMMVLAAILILVLSPLFILNGVLALALVVLIATYLEPPERAARWGILTIILFAAALTLRLNGPFEAVDLAPADLAALYVLPTVGLMAFLLLGRNATGRLQQALGASETARRELETSTSTLQKTQAALEETNEQLRTELTERHRTEAALQVALDGTDHGQRLVLALGQAAQAVQAVQQARTSGEIFDSLGQGLAELGRGSIVLQLHSDAQQFELVWVSYDSETLQMLEGEIGFPLLGYRFDLRPGGLVQQTLERGGVTVTDRTIDYVAEALPPSLWQPAEQLLVSLGARRTIFAPLVAGDEILGLFAVGASGLRPIEEQAISIFANQAAVALSNVRLLQEARTWAAELERRVDERTAAQTESEARYRRLFDSSRDAVYVFEIQGNFIDANPSGCELLGYSREELLALNILQLSPGAQNLTTEAQQQFREEMQAEWREGLIGAGTEVLHKNGKELPVEVTITPLAYQGQEAVLAAVRDVTARKKADAELRRSRAESLQNHRRLLALSQAAQAVQRARTTQEVYEIVGNEVKGLGFPSVVFTTTSDPAYLQISHATFEPRLLRAAETIVGLTTRGARIRLDPDEHLQRIIDAGECVYFEQTAERVARGVPRLARPLIDRVVALLGVDRAIYAPLAVAGELHGLLMVAGRDLLESDVPAVAVLANQAGIAIENAQLMEEQRANQARMQQLARQVVSAQEDERRRLSHALHDEAGQALTALKINLELVSQDLPPDQRPVRERLGSAVAMVDSTMDDIRQLAQGLRPPALDTVGLDPTLAGLCSDFARRTQLTVTYRGLDVPRLPEPVSITLYRFLQEALTNVARHAKADQVRVVLQQDAEAVRLTVEDDGRGFDAQRWVSSPGNGPGMGLAGMWERLRTLDGHLETDSRPGYGTRLTAHIPLQDD